MATPTYTLIDSTVLGSSASSVTFSSIPATYRDLVLVVAGTIPSGFAPDININLNGDTNNANYSLVFMRGNGTTASSLSLAGRRVGIAQDETLAVIQIMDYSATDKHKTRLARVDTQGTSWGTGASASRWANTSAVTSVEIATGTAPSSSFQSGATFSLFGIEA